jgi:hypothetical protein
MHLGSLRARKLRGWVALLLLPALAVRVLVPEGFMPRFGADLEISMQMCHGDSRSSAVMRVLQGEAPAPAGEDGQQHSACAFAATSAAAPPEPALDSFQTALQPDAEALPTQAAPAHAPHHRPQTPRAPPTVIRLVHA